jgi:hypothetical protein
MIHLTTNSLCQLMIHLRDISLPNLHCFCVTPGFKELNQVSHICAQEVHTYVKMKKYQKQCYLFNIHIAIITLTSEYCGTVTKLQAPFLSRTADWGSVS